MGPRAGLDGRKISSRPRFDPGPSSPQSVAIPTELLGPHNIITLIIYIIIYYNIILIILNYNIIILWDHRRICDSSLTETSLFGA